MAGRPIDKSKGLSIRAYAEHRKALGLTGGSPYMVTRALREGRITKNKHKKIDPEAADAAWAANVDPALDASGKLGNQSPARSSGAGVPTYAQSRAIREAYRAKITRLEYEEKNGRLVDASGVKVELFKQARMVRDHLLGIPQRIAPALAALGDITEVEQALETEIRVALEGLSGV